jgi:hypothetical protein
MYQDMVQNQIVVVYMYRLFVVTELHDIRFVSFQPVLAATFSVHFRLSGFR